MTNNLITLTIPNDDHVALRAFGKALEEMALAHGAPLQVKLTDADVRELKAKAKERGGLIRVKSDDVARQAGIDPAVADAYVQGCHDTEARLVEIDTTAQQVESLCLEKLYNLDPKTPLTDKFPQHCNEAASQAINDAIELGCLADKTGTPWDERIHSTSKALNADGSWRLRRKPKDMDEAEWAALVESVKNELMGIDAEDLKDFEESKQAIMEEDTDELQPPLYEIAPGHIGVMQPEPPVTPPGDDFHTDTGVVTEQTIAAIPPIPVPPPVVVPAPPLFDDEKAELGSGVITPALARLAGDEPEHWDFPKLMTFLTERHGKIDVATVNTLLAGDGLSSIQELNAHPDKIGPFVARVKAHLGE